MNIDTAISKLKEELEKLEKLEDLGQRGILKTDEAQDAVNSSTSCPITGARFNSF